MKSLAPGFTDAKTVSQGECYINFLCSVSKIIDAFRPGLAGAPVSFLAHFTSLLCTLLPKAGNSNTAKRIALMKRFLALFGRERIAAILAGRKFVSQA